MLSSIHNTQSQLPKAYNPSVNLLNKTEDYNVYLQAWVAEAQEGVGEDRETAALRIKDCRERGCEKLDLSYLNLTSLPLLPKCRVLDVSHNNLTSFPEIKHLKLFEINAQHNQIETLPDYWPIDLYNLDVSNNRLSTWPHSLPDRFYNRFSCVREAIEVNCGQGDGRRLIVINLKNNQFTDIPQEILDDSRARKIHLEGNPLTEQAVRRILNLNSEEEQRKPRALAITFSMENVTISESDDDVISINGMVPIDKNDQWFSPNYIATFKNPGFESFLTRLGETITAKKVPAFKIIVKDWLETISRFPELRDEVFLIAEGATSSCEDRVSLTFSDMQNASLIHKIKLLDPNNNIKEIFLVAREMFRKECLADIAKEKIQRMVVSDDIEVHLALLTELKEKLNLTSVPDKMRFYSCSGILEDDLLSAEIQVKQKEKCVFKNWLAVWAPWRDVMKRFDTDRYQECVGKLLDYEEIDETAKKELKLLDIPLDSDSLRQMSKKIMDENILEVFTKLSEEILEKLGKLHLLDDPWDIK